jgi:hypothetical protein
MPVGLACAFGTSLCYGIGSVLQAVAAGAVPSSTRLDPRLLLRLMLLWRYLLGLALDVGGFALSLAALRWLPLYAVQSVVASFVAVTAVASVLVLQTRVSNPERAALVVVVLGLVLVSLSAAPEPPHAVGAAVAWLTLGAAVTLVVVSVLLAPRSEGATGAWALGGVAGAAFGVVAVAARALSSSWVRGDPLVILRLLAEAPATYAMLTAAPLALMTYAAALQRGSVVQATAPLVVGETVLPGLAGLALLGDHARPGWGVAGAVGFCLAVGAAVLLSRFGAASIAQEPGSG